MDFIAEKERIVFASPDPRTVFCSTPALLRLEDGRLIASFDLGGSGVGKLPGVKAENGDFGTCNQGRILVSDDHGTSWRKTADFPMLHARTFVAGGAIYLLGHNGKLLISRSDDRGESWSKPAILDARRQWHQSAGTVDYRHGKVYLTMEEFVPGGNWPGVAPVLMSAAVDTDLCRPENWCFSHALRFEDTVKLPVPLGVPFYPTGELVPDGKKDKRYCGDPGWLESHVLRIYDSRHNFYDPDDRTVLILMRAHTGITNIGAIARGTEGDDGSLHLSTLTTPAGAPLVFVPLPGGQMKFHVIHDPVGGCYWLVSSQATDSMVRPELLGDDRYGLPDNERNRLQLHFSRNLFDWCFAGMVAMGASSRESRHYASMAIDGDDLLILSRSGDTRANSAHNSNLVTLHQVKNFRALVY